MSTHLIDYSIPDKMLKGIVWPHFARNGNPLELPGKARARIWLFNRRWIFDTSGGTHEAALQYDCARLYFRRWSPRPLEDRRLNFVTASEPLSSFDPELVKNCDFMADRMCKQFGGRMPDFAALSGWSVRNETGVVGVDQVGEHFEVYLPLWGSEILVGVRDELDDAAMLHDVAARVCWNIPAPARRESYDVLPDGTPCPYREQGFQMNFSTPRRDAFPPEIEQLQFTPDERDIQEALAFKQWLQDTVNRGRELPHWGFAPEPRDVQRNNRLTPTRIEVTHYDRRILRHTAPLIAENERLKLALSTLTHTPNS
jgi:hypothetical protein